MRRKIPCRKCRNVGTLKPSKLTFRYWCRKCKLPIYTSDEMGFLKDCLSQKNSPPFSTVLRRLTLYNKKRLEEAK